MPTISISFYCTSSTAKPCQTTVQEPTARRSQDFSAGCPEFNPNTLQEIGEFQDSTEEKRHAAWEAAKEKRWVLQFTLHGVIDFCVNMFNRVFLLELFVLLDFARTIGMLQSKTQIRLPSASVPQTRSLTDLKHQGTLKNADSVLLQRFRCPPKKQCVFWHFG